MDHLGQYWQLANYVSNLPFLRIFLTSFNRWILFCPPNLRLVLGFITLLSDAQLEGKMLPILATAHSSKRDWLYVRAWYLARLSGQPPFAIFGRNLVPEQNCPFCSYALTLEHVTFGCAFVDAAVCCFGWEYFLPRNIDLELLKAKLRHVRWSTAKRISPLSKNAAALRCFLLKSPKSMFARYAPDLFLIAPPTPAYVGASGGVA